MATVLSPTSRLALLALLATFAGFTCTDSGGRLSADATEPDDSAPHEDAADAADVPLPDANESDPASDEPETTPELHDGIRLCETDEDCEPETCRPVDDAGEVRVCTTYCEDDRDCPDDWLCVPIGGGRDRVFACLPDNFCWDEDDDGYGLGPGCIGPDCDDNDPLTYAGAPEICNGKDNNCNGLVDSDPVGEGDPCDTGLAGVCGEGVQVCTNGSMECVQVNFPADVEVCDGRDNTCDGQVDVGEDGLPLERPCYPGDPANLEHGICEQGIQQCVDGGWSGSCVGFVLPREERCNGLDDNCDGLIDNDPFDVGQACNTGLLGRCSEGAWACVDGERTCVPLHQPAAEEVCDSLDWTCDGFTDTTPDGTPLQRSCFTGDDPDAAFRGECRPGTQRCLGGIWNPVCEGQVLPTTEVCDGRDNNCDGVIDNPEALGSQTWYLDADGDGFGDPDVTYVGCAPPDDRAWVTNGDDCDDSDPTIHPGADELCDGIDRNCSGVADDGAVDALQWFEDADGDGFGNADVSVMACAQPEGFVDNDLDCDDTNPDVHPDADEICDGIDNNCSGAIDDDAIDMLPWWPDADGDGWGRDEPPTYACTQPPGYAPRPGDCDDTDPNVNPGATEICDGIDNNCSGVIDDGEDGELSIWFRDADGDGFGDPDDWVLSCDPPEGYVDNDLDCDDTDARTFPGADEICDGIDRNCSGVADDGALDAPTWFEDADGDGFGNPDVSVVNCAPPEPDGWVLNDEDCDDTDPTIYPGAEEFCDGIDRNCSGVADDGATDRLTWFEDADGDGFGNPNVSVLACQQPDGYVDNDLDCDDTNPDVNPDAIEICDGIDNNCDGHIDTFAVDRAQWFEDADGDGFGNPNVSVLACEQPLGYVEDNTDCNDDDDTIFPGADEYCDGIDRNCSGVADDGALDAPTWFEDADGDGFGNPDVSVVNCAPPEPDGWVLNDEDCDDTDPTIYPGAEEFCDGIDRNCSGVADDGATDRLTWFEDADGDGFGNPNVSVLACEQPLGYVDNDLDCDDTNPDVNPDAIEICDGIDNNCDGHVDTFAVDRAQWFEDADGDGFGNPNVSLLACEQPLGYVEDNTDCNDDDDTIFPGADEFCDGVDRNCSGVADDGALDATRWYQDADNDGFGNPNVSVLACQQPDGYVEDNTDCDDTDPLTYPGATEICNGKDNNCNGIPDDGLVRRWYRDNDGDGFGDPAIWIDACNQPIGYVEDNTDCDDNDPLTYPGAPEICNGKDNNCNGIPDDGLIRRWYRDNDGDGFGDPAIWIDACNPPIGYVEDNTDCNDNDNTIYPGAPEICNGKDNNCNGIIDDGVTTRYYRDADGDGLGDPNNFVDACSRPPGYVTNNNDCDDTDPNIGDRIWWYMDADRDGYGAPTPIRIWPVAVRSCPGVQPPDFCPLFCFIERIPYVDNDLDCDDTSDRACPTCGPQVCDGVDNDCSGTRDNGFERPLVFYRDSDGDGFGDPNRRIETCGDPNLVSNSRWVTNGDDCDDSNAQCRNICSASACQ